MFWPRPKRPPAFRRGVALSSYKALERTGAARQERTGTELGASGPWAGLRPKLASWRPPAWLIWPSLALGFFYAYGMGFLWGHYMFLDLRVYMGSAHEVLVGRDPYNYAFTFVKLYATYPPFALAILSPLSLVPVHAMVYLWSLASLACLALLLSLGLKELGPAAWQAMERRWRALVCLLLALAAVIVVQPVRSNFGFGQINIFLITMGAADVLRRRGRSRGVLIGLAAAVKFTPLVFVVLLVLERDWRSAARAVAAFVGATAITWVVAPGISAQYFLHLAAMDKRIGTPTYVSNQSINGILHRAGMGGTAATVTWFVLSVLVLVVAAVIARRILDSGENMLLALLVVATAGLLASPISWDHHWSWVALFPLALLDKSLRRPVRAGILAVIVVAVAAFYWWHYSQGQGYGIPTGPLTPLADDSLALSGVAFLGCWLWALRKDISLRDFSPWSLLAEPLAPAPAKLAGQLPSERSRANVALVPRAPLQWWACLNRRQRWRKNTRPSRRRAFERPE